MVICEAGITQGEQVLTDRMSVKPMHLLTCT